MQSFTAPISTDNIKNLRSGDQFFINGTIYTARDAAHKKLIELMQKGQKLPFDLQGSIIYYCGPSPASPQHVIGACGPTTSGRMDIYTPQILEKGVKILIGKGGRSSEFKAALQKHQAIYCAATGGAGALLSKCVTDAQLVAFAELGTEAIQKLTVKDFPVTVINDIVGNDLYKDAIQNFSRTS